MREPVDSSYTNFLYTQKDLAKPFSIDFKDLNLTAHDFRNMTFKEMERYSDVIFAERY